MSNNNKINFNKSYGFGNQESNYFNNINTNPNPNLYMMNFQQNNNFYLIRNDMKNTFSQLNESFQHFCNNNISNILTLFTNISKLIEFLKVTIREQNISKDIEKNNSKINYLLFLTDDLKKQMTIIQYYNKLQKFFTNYIMKNVENLIDQVCNQNFWNFYEQNNGTINQIQPNLFDQNNLFNLNPIQFSIPQSNILNNTNLNHQFNLNNLSSMMNLKEKKNTENEQKFFEMMKNDVKKNLKFNQNKEKLNDNGNLFTTSQILPKKNNNLFEIISPKNKI